MSKVDYKALREAAEAAKGKTTWQKIQAFKAVATPEVVLELLDALDALPKAEPVAWTDEEELRDVREYGFGEIFQCPPDKYADSRRVIPLYRELPAPVVPDEMYWQDAPVEGSIKAAAYATGWNACRAAMLRKGGDCEKP